MSISNETLERIRRFNAVHEVGHAVAAVALGGCVNYVYVNNANPLSDFDFGQVCRAPMNDVEKEVIVCLSGMGAEVIMRGGTWSLLQTSSGQGDWKKVQRYLREYAPDERRNIVKHCKMRSIEMLTDNWLAVLSITDALQAAKDGLLGADEMLVLFNGVTPAKKKAKSAKAGQ